ncbi:transferase family-domain-containing protein [Lophiotrema nucula]|uniref:Transferase family-domain-containing protein n=1 Tax=Lophiotrema nucula TaxID=690887 RepID=A0A6A5Z0D0_9PLEO|nr:transferase family-domain-containing protein [Lophiotrema nucula]
MEDIVQLPASGEVLDIFGQSPRLSRLYTQLCFCFPIPEDTPGVRKEVVDLLRCGLHSFTSKFPWVAGQVVRDDGLFKIVRLGEVPQLTIQEHGARMKTYRELRQGGFPFSSLDEKEIASRRTLPERLDEPAPVLALQITFVDGGVLLTFSAQHNCMDMAGQCQVIHLFAKACRGEYFMDEELRTGCIERRNIIPLLESTPEYARSAAHDAPNETIHDEVLNAGPQEEGTWSYFLFSAASLTSLKALAIHNIDSGFVSTDDTVSAFVWKHVTLARRARVHSTGVKSTFERQVNVRKHLNIPSTYTGNAVHKLSTTATVEDLVCLPLGHIASRLRSSLEPDATLGHQAREAATALHREVYSQQHDDTMVNRPKVSSLNIKMSSWAKEKCYEFDFGGVLQKPEAVRRPNFEGWEGLAYFMPRRLDGEIAVALNLRNDDLERLRLDEEFGKYGRYVG